MTKAHSVAADRLRRKGVKVAFIGERAAGRPEEAAIEGVDDFYGGKPGFTEAVGVGALASRL